MTKISSLKMFNPTNRSGILQYTTAEKIISIVGFEPNLSESDKIQKRWSFEYDGHKCSIWEFRNTGRYNQYSVYGNSEIFKKLFGKKNYEQELDDFYINQDGQPRSRPGLSSYDHLW